MGVPARPVADRFWEKVDTPDDGCWEWRGRRRRDGYGLLATGPRGCIKMRAHRLSWELHHGAIPVGLPVLHRCDNPPCVRPDHLFLGTRADNRRDMVTKGRDIAGERTPHALLTAKNVIEIRALVADGATQASVARRYGVSRSEVWRIVHGQTWKSLL